MSNATFNGLRVLALESRRAREMAQLITHCGGDPVVAPSVREVALESNQEALEFVRHLFQVAENMACASALHDALAQVVIASIGPLTSEELRSRGLNVDMECAHPKMGFLVREAAEKSGQILQQKKRAKTARE
jgi:uroporphyrinogen-III synthase